MRSAITVTLGTLLLLGASAESTYDRVWWESTGKDERTQFVAGYLDCAAYDDGNTRLAEAQWNGIEPEITRYYTSHPQMTRRTVPSLILALGAASRSTDPAGERYPEKHGIFDGDYWRQITQSGRIGFVEGYLACRTSGIEKRQFAAHTAAWYVSQIDRTYRLTPEDGEDENDASKKIASIIQKLTR
jgi:hypothetical protein